MKVEIGGKMYLFLSSGKAGDYADNVVISAHGGIKQTANADLIIPYGNLQFYSQHGVYTDDFGLHNFATGGKTSQKTERLSTGHQCHNYDLSKYQGRHNEANETYASIVAAQANARDYKRTADNERAQNRNVPYNFITFDVLTIRHRFFRMGVSLKDVLNEMGRRHRYQEIHCYFCRSFY